MKKVLTGVVMGIALAGFANEVPVIMQSGIDGSLIEERDKVETGTTMTTARAPSKSGYIFVGWTSSDANGLTSRDRLGRALEAARQMIYGETLLTANYVAEDVDSDNDGVADGYELYWYGDLDETAESDTDGDGYDFAAELAAGTDPLMADRGATGGIVWDDGEKVQYNPDALPSYVVRSEPEVALFETYEEFVKPGTRVTTVAYGTASGFAYWTTNGVRVADRHGRAKDSVSFLMGDGPVEIVAVCEEDAELRQQLYWYGEAIDPASDTDGDGYTFAQEIAAGTDPLMADRGTLGGIVWDDGEKVQYNPDGMHEYVVRSEPEGTLFTTISEIVKRGTVVTTASYDPRNSTFAYWTTNGVRVADRRGRARDFVTFTMGDGPFEAVVVCEEDAELRQQLYWYGEAIDPASDTDGDGYTYAQEIAAGTDPLMADRGTTGGIVWNEGALANVNLQLYDQAQGAIVDDEYAELFFSPYSGNRETSRTFAGGAQIWPVVGDVNGDGLWDIVVVSEGATNVFVNVGSKSNPEFKERGLDVWTFGGLDVQMNSTEKLAGMAFDVEPVGALSATTNGTTLLVSDEDGRIWYYTSQTPQTSQTLQTFSLQHKVWGGSFGGFAKGLMLAAVDWEDDGDLDCLCGTADGKLMLLRDPKAGRPTNLKALGGVDSVKLDWDPNAQSRVRGYRVYRAYGANDELGMMNDEWRNVANPSLPTCLDLDLQPSTYSYKVTSVSRFYTSGNSTPTESESAASDVVRARVGVVRFTWGELVRNGEDGLVEQRLSIENSLNYDATGLVVSNAYDTTKLRFVGVEPSGLSDGLTWEVGTAEGLATVTVAGGEVAAGSGTFLTFVFEEIGEAVEIDKGDLDGDGELTKDDLKALAKLMHVWDRKPTDEELAAGDYNGNGRLDPGDYIIMRLDFIRQRIVALGERILEGGAE